MDTTILLALAFLVLLTLELAYFRIAARRGITDRPNSRSSHTRAVLKGGGVIFTVALWLWSVYGGFAYPWLLAGTTLAAGVSFLDDLYDLPVSVRLAVQFLASVLVLREIGVLDWGLWWLVPVALVVCVGATNIYNFMDGINGMTGGYSLAVLMPLLLLNRRYGFMEEGMAVTVGLSLAVFCLFNFRTRARCFAGDVGSIGIAQVIVFCLGRLVWETGDVTWLVLFLLYSVDGCLTLIHRMMLHENLGLAHRKHAYQLMVNELKVGHVWVSALYAGLQLAVSLVAVYVIPDTAAAHWIYFGATALVMAGAYILFMRKYYHLHEEYLDSLKQ